MNRWVGGLIAVTATCCLAQQIDLSSLDKLEAKAKSVNRVNLTGDQLKDGLKFGAVPKDVTDNLKGIQVRNYEFDGPGKYTDADLDAVRKQISALSGWTKIIESKEDKEHSEIFMCSEPNKEGIAIISAEPTEISVVFIRGAKNLGALHGLRGLGAPTPPTPPTPPPAKSSPK